jgi:hypothetical protein
MPQMKGPRSATEWLTGKPDTHESCKPTDTRKDDEATEDKGNREPPRESGTKGKGGKGGNMYAQQTGQITQWSDVGPNRPERTELLMGNFPRGTQAQIMKLWARDRLTELGIQEWVSHYQPMYARGENMLIGFTTTDNMYKALNMIREAQLHFPETTRSGETHMKEIWVSPSRSVQERSLTIALRGIANALDDARPGADTPPVDLILGARMEVWGPSALIAWKAQGSESISIDVEALAMQGWKISADELKQRARMLADRPRSL